MSHNPADDPAGRPAGDTADNPPDSPGRAVAAADAQMREDLRALFEEIAILCPADDTPLDTEVDVTDALTPDELEALLAAIRAAIRQQE